MKIMGKNVRWYELPIKVIKHCGREIIDRYRDHESVKWLRALKNREHDSSKPIKVGFIVQMPEIWDKEKPVFDKMQTDERFMVRMIIVPAFDFEYDRIGEYGVEKDYFIKESGGKYALARKKDGSWLEIKRGDFDYIFYQRPYNHYLPNLYQSHNLVRKSKLCYIPYATTELRETVTRPRDFFRDLSIGFMEDADTAEELNAKYRRIVEKGIQKFVSIGYPAYEHCIKDDFYCDYRNVLWAPRWSYDPQVGGSHFFEYVHQLEATDWNGSNLTIRPHPLMWENFLKSNLCTESDIQSFLAKWNNIGISIDKNNNIEETFNHTDILISDMSSIIAVFFLTGKPVIFCPKEPYDPNKFSPLLKKILPGLYVAQNWKELNENLEALLRRKDDRLKQKRLAIIKENFVINSRASQNIVDFINNDFLM